MFLATRWLGPTALAAALALTAFAAPAPADAAEPKVRVIVDLGDVIFRSGHPYYRHGNYGYDDRLIVQRDRRGRPVYYRYAPRDHHYGNPPYGNAYGHRDHNLRERRICDSRGRCRVEYYDPRYDRRYGDSRYDDRYYSHHDRRWDDRRRYDDRRYGKRDDDDDD